MLAIKRVILLKSVVIIPVVYADFSTTIFFPVFLPFNLEESSLGGKAIL